MARSLRAVDRRYDDLVKFVYGKGYTVSDMARWLDITRTGMGYKIRCATPFTVSQALIVKEKTDMSWDDFEKFFKGKDD